MKKICNLLGSLALLTMASVFGNTDTSIVTFLIETDVAISATDVTFPTFFASATAPTTAQSYVSNSGTVGLSGNSATTWQLTVDGATAGTFTLDATGGYTVLYELYTDIPQDAVSAPVTLVSASGVQTNPIAGRQVTSPGTTGNFYNATANANPSANLRFAINGNDWATAVTANADAFTSDRLYTDTLTWTFTGT